MKRKKMRCILSMVLMIAVLLSTSSLSFAAENIQSATAIPGNEEMVANFWESMNGGNWADWISYYPDQIQTEYLSFVSQENLLNNVGILTISHSEVISVARVANVYAPKMYPELQEYFERETTYECYKVDVVLDVKAENAYFLDGNNSFLTIAVKDETTWRIGAICKCPAELSDPYGISTTATGIGYGLISFISEPTTISVMDETGTIHTNESFSNFIFNVTCNEIGNEGFDDDAVKAQIIAIKMCGWWAKAGGYRAAYGCDIKHGDVAYKSYNAATAANQATIQNLVNYMDGFYMVSSAGTGEKLFFASFYAGGANSNGQGQGRLRQNGANYLATEYEYTWDQILHYYYDNSAYNNPNVGIVSIKYAS